MLMGVTLRSNGGFAAKEALLGMGVLVLAAAILIPIGMSMFRRSSRGRDVERMRDLYVSLTMYQEGAGGEPPPDLSFLNAYQPDPGAYVALNDPYAAASGPFPVDGSLPKGNRTSPYRISFAYLWAHKKGLKWETVFKQPHVGLIADEWLGNVAATGNFAANVSGTLMRVNVDGSLTTTNRTALTALGSTKDLFDLKSTR